MALKLNRNTKAATAAASDLAEAKRAKVVEEVRTRIFEEWCTCEKCRQGNYKALCITKKEIARTANTLGIPTPRGKIGTWQAITVKNLFRWY